MIEDALKYELINFIPGLEGQIYPTNAPKSAARPYLIYTRHDTDMVRTLSGYTGNQELRYMFSVMARRYEDMLRLRGEVVNVVLGFQGRQIGEGGGIYIMEVDINNIDEAYEFNLGVNRGIIDFTIHF